MLWLRGERFAVQGRTGAWNNLTFLFSVLTHPWLRSLEDPGKGWGKHFGVRSPPTGGRTCRGSVLSQDLNSWGVNSLGNSLKSVLVSFTSCSWICFSKETIPWTLYPKVLLDGKKWCTDLDFCSDFYFFFCFILSPPETWQLMGWCNCFGLFFCFVLHLTGL